MDKGNLINGYWSKVISDFGTDLDEAKLKFRPVAPPPNDSVPSTEDSIVEMDTAEDLNYSDIESLSRLSERRDQRYNVFDQMRQNDSLASAALEMYADDITQPDPQGRTIWAESDNAEIADAANRLIRVLDIESDIWVTAYSLVCYGDVYYELFRTPTKGTIYKENKKPKSVNESKSPKNEDVIMHKPTSHYVYDEYIERVVDPSELFDLTTKGHTVGFARTHVNESKTDNDGWNNYYNRFMYRFNVNDIDIYDSQKFIHIYVPDAGVRHPYKIRIDSKESVDKNGKKLVQNVTTEFTVTTGKSLLQDAYKTSMQLQLTENSILLSRLTRASIYRLIQVNTGRKSEKEAKSLILRIRNLLDKKQTISTIDGSFGNYNNPGPEVTNIVVPVNDNNQGAITSSTIGGDYDPKSLSDLDYLINKELASFKIPRQYLNFTDGGGFNGGSSLAKISSQYAHRITRYKRAIISGVTDLINIFFDNKAPSYVGHFEVKMTQVNTTEDAERIAMARDKLEMVSQIMSQLDSMNDLIGKFEILKDAFNDAYPNSVVAKVLGDYIDKLKNEQIKSDGNGNETGNGDGGSTPPSGGGDSSFLSSGGDNSPPEPEVPDIETPESNETGSEFPTDLSGDIDYTDTAAIDELEN